MVVVERLAALMTTGDGGTQTFPEGWETDLYAFVGADLAEDPSRWPSLCEGIAALATTLSSSNDTRSAAQQLLDAAAGLAARLRGHAQTARREGERKRRKQATLLGTSRTPPAGPAAVGVPANPLARFALSKKPPADD